MMTTASSDAASWTTTRKVLVGSMGVLLTVHTGIHLWDAANPFQRVNWPLAVIVFALFADVPLVPHGLAWIRPGAPA